MDEPSGAANSQAALHGHKPTEQQASRGSVSKQARDQVPVLVELRCGSDNRHDTVSQREVEQRIDLCIRHALRQHPQCQLRLKLGAEPLPPALLIDGKSVRIQPIAAQGRNQRLGRKCRADEAVVNATARRRLHKPRGIADDQKARRERPGEGRKRQQTTARLADELGWDTP